MPRSMSHTDRTGVPLILRQQDQKGVNHGLFTFLDHIVVWMDYLQNKGRLKKKKAVVSHTLRLLAHSSTILRAMYRAG